MENNIPEPNFINKNKKILIALAVVVLLGIVAAGAFIYLKSKNDAEIEAEQEQEQIQETMKAAAFEQDRTEQIAYAKNLYDQWKAAGGSFASGPCLANGREWAIDVAHNPRQAMDDEPSNQCSSYLNGTAEYFVELDTEGNVLRAE